MLVSKARGMQDIPSEHLLSVDLNPTTPITATTTEWFYHLNINRFFSSVTATVIR